MTDTNSSSSPSTNSYSGGGSLAPALGGALLGSALANGGARGGYGGAGGGVMPIINANSADGRAQFVNWNPYELKPRDPASAMLAGGFGGLITGGLIGGIPMFVELAKETSKLRPLHWGLLSATALAGGLVGAFTGYRNTLVHNSWADRFTKAGFEQSQNQGMSR